MAKIFNSRIIMLTIASILVIALLVACVLVSIKPKSSYEGVLDAGEILKTENVVYSLETENQFRQDVSVLLENIIASFFNTIEDFQGTRIDINNSSAISNPLLSIFSKAGIPSDKLLNFSSYLKNLDTDDAVISTWLFFIRVDEQPDGTYVGRFATPTELAEIFTGKVDFAYAIDDVVKNTALTAEEVGRLIYELTYNFAGSEQQEVLKSIGRADFVSLFVSTTTIYEAYVEFSLAGGSLKEARMLGELAYEMGAKLDELIESHGVRALLVALLLDDSATIDDTNLKEFLTSAGVDTSTLADVTEVNTALRAGINLAEFALYFARTALLEVGNEPFEYLANYYAQEKENADHYLYMHQLTLSRALVKGIDDALAKGGLLTTKEELIDKLATFKLTVEEVELDVANPDQRLSELKVYFREYLDVMYALNSEFNNVLEVEDVATLSPEQLQSLVEKSSFLTDFNYNELTIGADNLASTIIINITFNIMSQAMEEALGEVVS